MVAPRRRSAGATFILAICAGLTSLCGCYSLPQNLHYKGPEQRPILLEDYYARDKFTGSYTDEVVRETDTYVLHRFTIESMNGPFKVDYYKMHKETDSLIFVFPVLGGKKNIIENYFADYFVNHGLDAAIVQRNDDFKKPENFDRLEELMRANVVRDRMAIDFFEEHFGKKQFGTFGISRGAINVAITAGVDERLKYNVMLMGGSDLVRLFRTTDQSRVRKFVKIMMDKKSMTEPALYNYLEERIKTDPKYLARYIDGRKSLLLLAQFDSTVPIRTGFQLRHELGDPETIVLMAGHYSSIAYTGIIDSFLPTGSYTPFPLDYVETESLRFYRNSFHSGRTPFELLPLRVLRLPFDIVARIAHYFINKSEPHPQYTETPWDAPLQQAATEPICAIQ